MRTILCAALLFPVLAACTPVHYAQQHERTVKLFLQIPEAKRVLIVDSLDNFRPREARRQGPTTWVVELPARSEFTYFYIVDGRIYVPECQLAEADDFGGRNCIFVPKM